MKIFPNQSHNCVVDLNLRAQIRVSKRGHLLRYVLLHLSTSQYGNETLTVLALCYVWYSLMTFYSGCSCWTVCLDTLCLTKTLHQGLECKEPIIIWTLSAKICMSNPAGFKGIFFFASTWKLNVGYHIGFKVTLLDADTLESLPSCVLTNGWLQAQSKSQSNPHLPIEVFPWDLLFLKMCDACPLS